MTGRVHSVYTHRYGASPPSYRAHCRDCDRYSSQYWSEAEARATLEGHTDDQDYGEVPEMAQVTAEDISILLDYSPRADATLIRWLDTGDVDAVPAVLLSDISYSERGREYEVITTANDLRQSGDWDTENPTDEDYEAFAQMLNQE